MKYSEELALRLKGVKSDEIAAMKEQEAKEAEEAAKKAAALENEKKKEEANALELAQAMIKDLEEKLEAKDQELKKVSAELVEVNNTATQKEEPEKYGASDVMMELFNKKKED